MKQPQREASVLSGNMSFTQKRESFPAIEKDSMPASYQSNVVYQFVRHCGGRRVSRTSPR